MRYALVAVLLLAGCAQGNRCEKPPVELVLATNVIMDGPHIENAWAVQSEDFDLPVVYYLSAEIDGPGWEGPGDTATWLTNALIPGPGALLLPVDPLATEAFGPFDQNVIPEEAFSLERDGAMESRECAVSE